MKKNNDRHVTFNAVAYAVFIIAIIILLIFLLRGCSSSDRPDPAPIPEPEKVKVESVSVNASSVIMGLDEEYQLIETVLPSNAEDKSVTWKSNDTGVVTVENGLVKAVALGKTNVIVTTVDQQKTATCEFTIVETPHIIHVTEVKLDKTSATLIEGETLNLTATINPTNATNKKVTWSSSNRSVARVDNVGYVSTLSSGTAIITVTSEDGGKTATCSITVEPAPVNVYKVRFVNNDGTLLKEYDVNEGSGVTYDGATPIYSGTDAEKEFYEFNSWNVPTSEIYSNLTVYAVYKARANKIHVSYLNDNEVLLYDVTINTGETPTYGGETPTKPVSDGKQYAFKEWVLISDKDGQVVYKAVYENCDSGLIIVDGEIVGYDGDQTTIIIPDSWEGKPITEIEPGAFENNDVVEEVIIPETVTIIGDSAFAGCDNLTNVTLPTENTLIIEDNAFSNCTNLTEIEIPDNTIVIGDYAFSGSGLETVTLPDSLTCIEEGTFAYCEDLTSINVADTITVIKFNAFDGCKKLTYFDFTYIKVIESYAFRGTSLLYPLIPLTCEYLGEDVFSGYDEITVLVASEIPLTNWHENFAGGTNVCYGYIGQGSGYGSDGLYYDFITEQRDGTLCAALVEVYGFDATETSYEIPGTVIDDTDLTSYVVSEVYFSINEKDEYNNNKTRDEFVNLASVTFPNSVERIGVKSFCVDDYRTTILKEIELPNNLIQINAYAFSGNFANKTFLLSLPYGLKNIENGAFASCYKLIVYIPDSVMYIRNEGFSNIYAIYTEVSKPGTNWSEFWNLSLEEATIYNCGSFVFSSKPFVYCNSGLEVILVAYLDTSITSFESNLSTLGTAFITTIGPSAFRGFQNLTNVNLASGSKYKITKIYENAFYSTDKLTSFTLRDDVVYIGSGVIKDTFTFTNKNGISYYGSVSNPFLYAAKVTDQSKNYFELENGCVIVGENLFSGKSNILSITLPNSIRDIERSAFNGCGISSLNIPTEVSHIAYGAFYGTNDLKSVTLPNELTSINREVFMFSGIESIVIPDNVVYIGYQAFYYCSELTSLICGSSCEIICSRAFSDCTLLSNVVLSDNCVSINSNAFTNCSSLTNINLKNVQYLAHGSFALTGLTSVVIPDSIEEVAPSCFASCEDLTSVTLGSNLKTIRYSSFEGCLNLENITIPTTVESIEYRAFQNTALKSITIPSSVRFMGTDVFNDCDDLETIYVDLENTPNTWSKNWFGNCAAYVIFTA